MQGDPTSPSWRRSVLGVHWKDWCWSWNSNTLATSCKELTHWKRPWCWEGLGAWGEGDDRGWDGWMASLTQWTWVWVDSGNWWWTGRPGVLRFMGSQRVGHDWATELNWTEGGAWLKNRSAQWGKDDLGNLNKIVRSILPIVESHDTYIQLYDLSFLKMRNSLNSTEQMMFVIPFMKICPRVNLRKHSCSFS